MFLHIEHIIKYCPQKLVIAVNICSFLGVTAQSTHPYKQQQIKFYVLYAQQQK
jgi:hypothetical protein